MYCILRHARIRTEEAAVAVRQTQTSPRTGSSTHLTYITFFLTWSLLLVTNCRICLPRMDSLLGKNVFFNKNELSALTCTQGLRICIDLIRVADPHQFNVDPDQAFTLNRVRIQVRSHFFTLMRMRTGSTQLIQNFFLDLVCLWLSGYWLLGNDVFFNWRVNIRFRYLPFHICSEYKRYR